MKTLPRSTHTQLLRASYRLLLLLLPAAPAAAPVPSTGLPRPLLTARQGARRAARAIVPSTALLARPTPRLRLALLRGPAIHRPPPLLAMPRLANGAALLLLLLLVTAAAAS